MMRAIVSLLLLALVCSVNAGSTGDAPAYLLCANARMAPHSVIYYMHPLLASTSHPIVPNNAPDIDYTANVSTVVFSTIAPKNTSWDRATFMDTTRIDVPLINSGEQPKSFFYNVDMNSFRVNINDTDYGGEAATGRFAYVNSLDQYWKFDSKVDVFSDKADEGTATLTWYVAAAPNPDRVLPFQFTAWWNTAADAYASAGSVAYDSNQQILYTSTDIGLTAQKNYTMLITYGINERHILYNVTSPSILRLRYSQSRKALFAASLEDDGNGLYVPRSIVEVDAATGKTRVLIDNLPGTYGLELSEAFNDVNGEWYFVWRNEWNSKAVSSFFVVNIDTKKVTEPVEFKYTTNYTMLVGITAYNPPPSSEASEQGSFAEIAAF